MDYRSFIEDGQERVKEMCEDRFKRELTKHELAVLKLAYFNATEDTITIYEKKGDEDGRNH